VETIGHIREMILSFAGYSFCKPHSASYAQVSFKSAYLRAHYPAEFMAAVISNEGGFYSPFAYVSEARRMGLQVMPPDINASEWHYTGQDRVVRMGFMQVKGVHRDLVDHLVAERSRNGAFRSLHEFLCRLKPDLAQACLFIKAGCCDSVAGELTRPALLWRALGHHGDRGRNDPSLYDAKGRIGHGPFPFRPILRKDEKSPTKSRVLGSRYGATRFTDILTPFAPDDLCVPKISRSPLAKRSRSWASC
jgi:hypothetical protein